MTNHRNKHHRATSAQMVSHALQRLRGSRERITQARRAILAVLARSHQHLTADEVANELVEAGVHRTTVFRAFEKFVELGIVTYYQTPGRATTYHLSTDSHLHAHCAVCHQVFDLPPSTFDMAATNLRNEMGFSFEPNRSSLVGTCVDCHVKSTDTNCN